VPGHYAAATVQRILVVDDEQSMREMLGITLVKEGFAVVAAATRAEASTLLAKHRIDLVISDIRLPDGDGIEILRHVKSASPETIVLMMTAYGTAESAVAALKLGAHDYLIKPFDIDELRIVVRNALEKNKLEEENRLLKAELRGRPAGIVGVSKAITAVLDLVKTVARTSSTVLITGESGTGKELVARAIHAQSPRADGAFVSINCGALPETLLESELFGHVRGAFTDAHQNKRGLFEMAHRGTLLLDEVSETAPSMQVKLLRVLQDKRVRRVGGTEESEVDVRVIAATNRPLEKLVRERGFREDLFYRLNVIPLRIPTLRERRDDISILAEHFLRRFAREMGKSVTGISPAAQQQLEKYDWPGNVRELENVIERAVALETTPTVSEERLPDTLVAPAPRADVPRIGDGFRLDEYLTRLEATLVREALEASGGDRQIAARNLGIAPRSLRYLVRKHGMGSSADKN
jgi:two-component system response regulator PilR (NtrC family)